MSAFRSVAALLASYSILLLGNGLFNTVVSLRAKSAGFSGDTLGVVLSAYYAGLLLSAFYAALIIAKLGHVRAFALFASVASTVALFHLLWVSAPFWGVLRILSGFCMGAMIVVTEGWLNDKASNTNRGTILSLYMIATYACAGLAQFIMRLTPPEGFQILIIISILYSFALLPVLTSQTPAPAISSPKLPNIMALFRVSPVGMLGSFIVGILNGTFYSYVAIFAQDVGLHTAQIATFVAIGISSGMLLQYPLGRFSDFVDRRWIILFSSAGTAVVCYLLSALHNNTSSNTLYWLIALYGAFAFSIYPVCVAHTNDLTPANERTQTSSGLLMFYGIGAVIGPISVGALLGRYPISQLFILSMFASGFLAVYCLIRLLVKPRRNQRKARFIPFFLLIPSRKLFIKARHSIRHPTHHTKQNPQSATDKPSDNSPDKV